MLQTVRWDLPKEPPGVNDYMELLVKETVTLHKVLSRYLTTSVVEVSKYSSAHTSGLVDVVHDAVCHVTSLRSYQS